MQDRPKVLMIVPGPLKRRTGGSIYNLHIVDDFKQNGFDLDTVSVPDLPYIPGLAASVLLSPWVFLRLIRFNPDLIIEDAWAHPPLILFNILCRFLIKTKLIIVVHQVRSTEVVFGRSLARLIETATLRSARVAIAVSRFTGSEVERITGGRVPIVVARPGSDGTVPCDVCETSNDTRSRKLNLLFAGSCTRRKGLQELIEALALVRDLPLRLDLAGSTDVEPRFMRRQLRLVDSLGLAERVVFHGLVDSATLARLYSSADIFVFPSHYEGYGIVLAEAMKAGLPIIATEIGPAIEILSKNENALIVPPQDAEALASGIRRLAEDSSLRERFGRRSRELAEKLPGWSDTCNIVREAVQECMGK